MATPRYTKLPFPQEAFQLGKTYQFGEPQEQYTTQSRLFVGCIVLLIIGFIAPVIATGGLHSPQGIIAIVIVLFVFSIALLQAFLQRKWRVYVYTDGFVCKKGRLVQALRWNEIELVRRVSFRSGVTASTYGPGVTRSIWIIRSKQRKIIEFGDEFYNMEALMKTIEAHVEKAE